MRVLILSFFMLCASEGASAQSADELSERLASRYEQLGAMRASFVHVATSDFMDSPERFSGTMIFAGSRYRIETVSQTIVTDGETTWIHNRAEGQVLINDYVEDEFSFSLTTFLSQFGNDYDTALQGSQRRSGQMHYVLELSPRDDFATFRSVELWMRKSDSIVTHLIVVDLNDVTMTFDLSDIEIDPPVLESTFSFDIPQSVEVIDLRN